MKFFLEVYSGRVQWVLKFHRILTCESKVVRFGVKESKLGKLGRVKFFYFKFMFFWIFFKYIFFFSLVFNEPWLSYILINEMEDMRFLATCSKKHMKTSVSS